MADEKKAAVKPRVTPAEPGGLPTSSERTYLARGIKGRDGKGAFTITNRGAVMMPNGDTGKPGDTFDPEVEGFSGKRLAFLMARQFVTGDKKVLDKLMRAAPVTKAQTQAADDGEDS